MFDGKRKLRQRSRAAEHRERRHRLRERYQHRQEDMPTQCQEEEAEEARAPRAAAAAAGPAEGLLLGVLRLYREAVSPLLPPACRYYPSCSRYGIEAITRYGAGQGFVLFMWRLVRCSPLVPIDRNSDQVIWRNQRFCVLDAPELWHGRLFGTGSPGSRSVGGAAAARERGADAGRPEQK
ncbi:unnamed protein product, partial [Prorocentrum cordatum]